MTYLKSSWAWGTALCGALVSLGSAMHAQDLQFSPEVGLELAGFPDDPAFDDQFRGFVGAIIATGKLSWRSDTGDVQVVLDPYLRYDSRDGERTYADLRRGFLRYFGDGWDVTIGADRHRQLRRPLFALLPRTGISWCREPRALAFPSR